MTRGLVVVLAVALAMLALVPEAAGATAVRARRSGRRSGLTPVADAGADQQVASLATVTLDGTASISEVDADFTWSQVAGPTVTLSDVHDEQPTFVAPIGPATLTFGLTVVDATGSASDEVTVTVGPLADHFTDAEFVAAQYQDFLGRQPTSAELQAKLDQLTSGALTRLELVEAMLVDPVFTQPLEGAVEAYETVFGRLPDRDGLRWWVAQRRHEASVSSLTDKLMDSHEYATHDALMTDQQYVQHLYTDVLGRPADPSGLAYWTHRLAEPAAKGRSYCGSYASYCRPCSSYSSGSGLYAPECQRRRRRRRRQAALSIAYSLEGRQHLQPLLLVQHADVAMLHLTAPLPYVQTEITTWGSTPSALLPLLLLSPAYGHAHGW